MFGTTDHGFCTSSSSAIDDTTRSSSPSPFTSASTQWACDSGEPSPVAGGSGGAAIGVASRVKPAEGWLFQPNVVGGRHTPAAHSDRAGIGGGLAPSRGVYVK